MARAAQAPSRRRFTIAQLAMLVPFVALIRDSWAPIRDNSFLWHIRAGSLQSESIAVLTEDPFSFTMFGEPWRTQSWLADLLYAWGEALSGLAFTPVMMLAASTVTFVGIGLIAYKRSRSLFVTALLMLLTLFLILGFLVPRPVILSFSLFVLTLNAWENPRTRWAVPFIFWIWASVHGSFVIGLAYIVLKTIADKEWKAWPTSVMSGAVTLLTAHGLGVLAILLRFAEVRPYLALLQEWRAPELLSAVFLPFFVGIALLLAGATQGRLRSRELWVVIPFLALGLTAVRAVPPAWLGLIPFIASSQAGVELKWGRGFDSRFASVFAVAVLVLPILLIEGAVLDEERFPIEASKALDPLNTFHDDRAGGYLIWAYGPEDLVFIDDRAELYGERLEEFVQIQRGVLDWEPVFERDGIEQALLREGEPLIGWLEESGWQVIHSDDNYSVLRP